MTLRALLFFVFFSLVSNSSNANFGGVFKHLNCSITRRQNNGCHQGDEIPFYFLKSLGSKQPSILQRDLIKKIEKMFQ